jgi:hypothetical protein
LKDNCSAFICRVRILLGLLDHEDEGTTVILKNVRNCLPDDTASPPRQLDLGRPAQPTASQCQNIITISYDNQYLRPDIKCCPYPCHEGI